MSLIRSNVLLFLPLLWKNTGSPWKRGRQRLESKSPHSLQQGVARKVELVQSWMQLLARLGGFYEAWRKNPLQSLRKRDRTPSEFVLIFWNNGFRIMSTPGQGKWHILHDSLVSFSMAIMCLRSPSFISFMARTLGLASGYNGDLCMPSTVDMANDPILFLN